MDILLVLYGVTQPDGAAPVLADHGHPPHLKPFHQPGDQLDMALQRVFGLIRWLVGKAEPH